MKTHIPFLPKIRVKEETVANELFDEILKCAKKYNKDVNDFSAKIELLPIPYEDGHYINAEVTYLEGDLTPKEQLTD